MAPEQHGASLSQTTCSHPTISILEPEPRRRTRGGKSSRRTERALTGVLLSEKALTLLELLSLPEDTEGGDGLLFSRGSCRCRCSRHARWMLWGEKPHCHSWATTCRPRKAQGAWEPLVLGTEKCIPRDTPEESEGPGSTSTLAPEMSLGFTGLTLRLDRENQPMRVYVENVVKAKLVCTHRCTLTYGTQNLSVSHLTFQMRAGHRLTMRLIQDMGQPGGVLCQGQLCHTPLRVPFGHASR